MVLAAARDLSKPFYTATIQTSTVWSKTLALQAIRRFLLDEITYEEVDDALSWFEDNYPTCRKAVMQLRCCLWLEEFVEYEQRLNICARHVLRLSHALK